MQMNKKKISILVFDLSSNALVRTYPLAKALSRYFNIEIIGVLQESEVYNPYQNEFEFKIIKKDKNGILGYIKIIMDIVRSIEGDIIYAFKPKLTSYGAGLAGKLYKKIPLVVDIEDLETAKWIEASFFKKLKLIFSRFDSENELINYLMEKLIFFADEKIIVSEYLKNKFGGTKIMHGVDTDFFNPSTFTKLEAKKKLGLELDHKYILFSGMPREHKGIEELILAIKNINNNKLKFLLVGGDINHKYYKKLLLIGDDILVPIGSKPHNEMPYFLAASDIVVLPQRDTIFARAQVPAKVFEAMAMKKPIISTDISDLNEILNGCGIIINPIKTTIELENKIKLLIGNSDLCESYGRLAREKCINEYSWDQMSKQLLPLFNKYLDK